MNAQIGGYAEYKDSGIAWLGDIPAHWSSRRLKTLFHEVDKRNGSPDGLLLSLTKARGLIPQSSASTRIASVNDLSNYKICRSGNLVMNRMQAWSGQFATAFQEGVVSPDYSVFVPSPDANVEFFQYLLRTPMMVGQFAQASRGIGTGFNRLYGDDFGAIHIAFPHPDEQAAIVKYVAHVDRKIDRFIRGKRRMIELLNEQKQAIIHQAVTRGLDPSVPMKDSGVEWLGEIPAHWEVRRVKDEFNCLDRQRVPLNSVDRGEMTSRAYDYYGASGVIDKVDEYLFDDELLLVAEDGANLVLRNLPLAIIARGQFWVNNHAHVLKPKFGSLEYYAYIVEQIDFRPYISGAAQPKLTADRLMSRSIPVPGLDEQRAIVNAIQVHTQGLQATVDHNQQEIELVREYRTRLISDVVTGKIDIRAAAAALPEIEDAPLPTAWDGEFEANGHEDARELEDDE